MELLNGITQVSLSIQNNNTNNVINNNTNFEMLGSRMLNSDDDGEF